MHRPASSEAPQARRHVQIADIEEPDQGRWHLIWRVLIFQFKLVIDGFRDLVLSPLSIVSAILGILFMPANPNYFFNRLIGWGRQTERWINLFDQYRDPQQDRSVDDYIQHVETVIRRDHARGGVSAATQEAVDSLIDKLRRQDNS